MAYDTKKDPKDKIRIDISDSFGVERALKKFKEKFDKTKAMKELRNRKEFTKPSVVKRQDNIRAVYREKMISSIQ